MKRSVVLLLVLLALMTVQAAEEEKCVCAEGEKNCPCLAQKDPGVETKGKLRVGERQVTLSAKPGSIKFGLKPLHLKARPSAGIKVRSVKVKPSAIDRGIPLKFKYKAIAPEERKRLLVLKNKMKKIKANLRQLKVVYRKAPEAERKKLVIKKQLYKRSRVGLKQKIGILKAKLHTLVKQHYEQCVKRTMKQVNIAKALVIKTKKDISLLHKKKEQLKNLIRVTAEEKSAGLCKELKDIKKKIKQKKVQVFARKKFLLKVEAAKKKATQKKMARSVARKDKKLNHLLLKYKKLAAKMATLKKRERVVKAKIISQKKTLQQPQLPPAQRLKVKMQIHQNVARVAQLLNKRKDLLVVKLKLRKRIQPLVVVVTKARRAMKRIKASNKCLGLQMKLSRELVKVKKLNAKFEKECSKALKSKSKTDIKKALHVKIKINKLKNTINKIKGHIRRVPLRQRKVLQKKQEKLLVKLHMLQVDLKKAKAKASAVKLKCEVATGEKRAALEKKVRQLIEKTVKIQKVIIDTKRGILLLKTTHKRDCEDAILKEKQRSKEMITNIKRKLLIAQQQAEQLHKALLATRKVVALKAEAARLKHEELQTHNKALQTELRKKRTVLKTKIVQFHKEESAAKAKAKRLQQELDQKSKAQLKVERAIAKKQEEEIENQMKDSIAKEEALRKALAKAHDEAAIDALNKQRKLELKRLNALNARLKESQEAQKALDLEAQLLKKMQRERQEEARLQRAILLKKMHKKTISLKVAFDIKAKTRKTARTTALKGVLAAKLQVLQNRYARAQSDFLAYSTALKASNKKRIAAALLVLRAKYLKKIKDLEAEINKERMAQQGYKVKMMKTSSEQLVALMKKLQADSDAKQLLYKKKITAVKAKGKQLIMAAQMKGKMDLAKLQADAKKKIANIKAQIRALKARFSKNERELQAKVLTQQKRKSGLQSDIALAKTKAVQRKKAHEAWLTKHKTDLQQVLDSEKKTSTNQLSAVKSEITKVKAKNREEEAALLAKLKAALAEIQRQKKSLEVEVGNYKKLKVDMSAWTVKQSKKLKTEVHKEKTVRKMQEVTMQAKLKQCRDKIINIKAKQLKLENLIDKKSREIQEIHDLAARQAKAKTIIVQLEGKMMKASNQIEGLKKTIEETCSEGSEGNESTCQEFRSNLSLILQKSADLKERLAEEREHFVKLH